MYISVLTEYLENYGDTVNPRWKRKSGSHFVISVTTAVAQLPDAIKEIVRKKLEGHLFNDGKYTQEYVVDVSLVDDYREVHERREKYDTDPRDPYINYRGAFYAPKVHWL